MRLFIGIELSGTAQDEILGVRERLLETVTRQGVRFVRPEKLHLTLAFLGQVDDAELSGLVQALILVGPLHLPLPIRVTGLGCFPDGRRPRVIWVGLDGVLQSLVDDIRAAAKPYAPELDEKPFTPHITLARISPGSKEVGRAIAHIAFEPATGEFTADQICLFHSKHDGSYEILHRVELRAGSST